MNWVLNWALSNLDHGSFKRKEYHIEIVPEIKRLEMDIGPLLAEHGWRSKVSEIKIRDIDVILLQVVTKNRGKACLWEEGRSFGV